MPDIGPVYRKLLVIAVALAGPIHAQSIALRNVVLDLPVA
jgi:hypothetical protein